MVAVVVGEIDQMTDGLWLFVIGECQNHSRSFVNVSSGLSLCHGTDLLQLLRREHAGIKEE